MRTKKQIRNVVLFHTDHYISKAHGMKAEHPELVELLPQVAEHLEDDQTLMVFNNEDWNFMMTKFETSVQQDTLSNRITVTYMITRILFLFIFMILGIIIGSFIWG